MTKSNLFTIMDKNNKIHFGTSKYIVIDKKEAMQRLNLL